MTTVCHLQRKLYIKAGCGVPRWLSGKESACQCKMAQKKWAWSLIAWVPRALEHKTVHQNYRVYALEPGSCNYWSPKTLAQPQEKPPQWEACTLQQFHKEQFPLSAARENSELHEDPAPLGMKNKTKKKTLVFYVLSSYKEFPLASVQAVNSSHLKECIISIRQLLMMGTVVS